VYDALFSRALSSLEWLVTQVIEMTLLTLFSHVYPLTERGVKCRTKQVTVRRQQRAVAPLVGVSRGRRPATIVEKVVTLLGTVRILVLKAKPGRRSIRPVLSIVVASIAERLATFLPTAPSQLETRRVTTVARRAILPRTAPTLVRIR